MRKEKEKLRERAGIGDKSSSEGPLDLTWNEARVPIYFDVPCLISGENGVFSQLSGALYLKTSVSSIANMIPTWQSKVQLTKINHPTTVLPFINAYVKTCRFLFII